MECTFALVGRGYVLVAADTTAARSIVKMKSDEDKTKTIGPHLVMAYSGEPGKYMLSSRQALLSEAPIHIGDTVYFAEYIERNLRLQQIRYLHELRPASAASWIRRALADSLRSRSPYAVNLLVGGFDTSSTAIEHGKEELGGSPKLYWIDYLGTLAEVPFAAHGYGSYFALSLLDRWVERLSKNFISLT